MSDSIFNITTPIYYINATPHIGHAYTQFAADARARFERLRGRRVYFLTGTDENAVKVSRVAQAMGRDPQEYVDEMAASFQSIWDELFISYDDYVRTTEPRHRHTVQRVVQRLWDDGHLYLDAYRGWYSVPDETFFGSEDTIERDGQRYIAAPTPDQSREPLEWVEEQGHFFRLSEFAAPLLDWYAEHPDTLQPTSRRNETLSFLRGGLRDTSISRIQDWGIALPDGVPEHEGRVVYVWFPDALLNYASAPGYLSEDPARRAFFDEVWPPDVHLMSKDIFTRFHATLWPSLLKALDLELPRLCFAHGFWTVEGRKMSKRDADTVVEPVAFAARLAEISGCEAALAVDALRYYCLREVTFGADGDFSRGGVAARYNGELANGLGNLINRALSMLQQYFEGVIPAAGEQNNAPGELHQLCRERLPAVEKAYGEMAFQDVLQIVWEVIGAGNRAIEEQKPWVLMKEGHSERVGQLLRDLLQVCQWCMVVLAPIMPNFSERLAHLLQIEPLQSQAQGMKKGTIAASHAGWLRAVNNDELLPGHRCLAPVPLFPRIKNLSEIEIVKNEENTMDNTQNTENVSANEINAAASVAETEVAAEATKAATIAYEDFAKIELKIGRVLSAERIPKADKLLKLQVDLGNEQRQILAGLAEHFEPESLVGQSVIVVANLAPRTMRGLESQGMILAASAPDGPPLSLVGPLAEVEPGLIVK